MTIGIRPETTDAELVQRAKAGELDAFELLTTRHEERVYALAMRIEGAILVLVVDVEVEHVGRNLVGAKTVGDLANLGL